MRLVRRREGQQRGGPVRGDDVDVVAYGEVFAVSAADVEAYASGGQVVEEAAYDRPGFVAGGGEVGGDLLVDGVDVGGFVGGGVVGGGGGGVVVRRGGVGEGWWGV